MEFAIHPLDLDLMRSDADKTITVKQGDTHRILKITLYKGTQPYPLSGDLLAVFTAKTEKGTAIFHECRIVENCLLYPLTAAATKEAGDLPCEIRLYGSDDALLTSARFTLRVEKCVYVEEDVLETEEANALTQLITRAQNAVTSLQDAVENGAFKGEKGEKGDKGEKGETGEKGDTGKTGEKGEAFTYGDFTPEQLAALKGEKGETGKNGYSLFLADKAVDEITYTSGAIGIAYLQTHDAREIAIGDFVFDKESCKLWKIVDRIQNSLVLTYLALLKGEKGEKGDKGDTGAPGEKGEKGDAYTLSDADKAAISQSVTSSLNSESWTFTLQDGTTLTRQVFIG